MQGKVRSAANRSSQMKSRIKVNCPLSVPRKCKCLWEMPPPMCHHHLRRRRCRHQRCCRQCQCQSHTLAAAGLHCVLTQLHERQLCVCVCVIYEVNVLSLIWRCVRCKGLSAACASAVKWLNLQPKNSLKYHVDISQHIILLLSQTLPHSYVNIS